MTIYDYLLKLQELQRDTIETNVNVEISTRIDEIGPWLCVVVTTEGWYEDEDEEDYLNVHLYSDDIFGPEFNEHRYNEIVEFINNLLKK